MLDVRIAITSPAIRPVAALIRAGSGPAPRTSRETAGSTHGSAGPNTPGRSAGPAPCAPSPGEHRPVQVAEPVAVLAHGRADDHADRPERPALGRVGRGDVVEDRLGHVRPSAATARCTAGPSGLEVSASTNTPRPFAYATSSSGRSDPNPGTGWR